MDYLKTSVKVGLKKYPESTYFGELESMKRQGIGIIKYQSGRIYEGNWKNDFRDGKGFEKFPNGSTYDGAYLEGKPHGLGKYTWISGEYYIGEWNSGKKDGKGTWKGLENEYYVGAWKNGKPEGSGLYNWKNGNKYEGEWLNGLKNGQGTDYYFNGDTYIGMFQLGKPHGFGKYVWNKGGIYEGNFVQGVKEGFGKWKQFANPPYNCYAGIHTNDKKNIFGIYKWSTGNYYIGEYVDDEREGIGEMNWTDGTKYIGQWNKGIQNGYGRMILGIRIEKTGKFNNNQYIGPIHKLNQSLYFLQSDFNIRSLAPKEMKYEDIDNDLDFNIIEKNINYFKNKKEGKISSLDMNMNNLALDNLNYSLGPIKLESSTFMQSQKENESNNTELEPSESYSTKNSFIKRNMNNIQYSLQPKRRSECNSILNNIHDYYSLKKPEKFSKYISPTLNECQ